MRTNKSYFIVYAEDFELMKTKLRPEEVLDILSGLSDLCIWGESEYEPKTNKQEYFWQKVLAKYKKDLACYNASVENGKKGGRPLKNKPRKNPDSNPNDNPDDNLTINPEETQIKTHLTPNTLHLTPNTLPLTPNTEKEGIVFNGKVIKLSKRDYDNWEKAYPDLNLYGELFQRDEWLATQPQSIQKKWFLSTSQYFLKQNAKRKIQNNEMKAKEIEDDYDSPILNHFSTRTA